MYTRERSGGLRIRLAPIEYPPERAARLQNRADGE